VGALAITVMRIVLVADWIIESRLDMPSVPKSSELLDRPAPADKNTITWDGYTKWYSREIPLRRSPVFQRG